MRVGAWPLVLALASPVLGAQGGVAPIPLPRTTDPVVVDGDLGDLAWRQAAVVDTFYETAFGDNRSPLVRTVARLMYDARYFYVGVECDDPEPSKIRAPYVDRDQVFGDQDNFAVFVDARNDRRAAQEFRVNPRGIQGDAIYNDANGNEDFSPDFYYDTAAQIGPRGWSAELRIPLSSLRYPRTDPQTWGILLWRNLPREYRYALFSSPIPRNPNCLICQSGTVTGLSGLPSASHLVAAPYATGQRIDRAAAPGAPLDEGGLDGELGLDVKWSPGAATTLDATLNPDFSQIEADVQQIAVNNRFALLYPEKRPFFLEGTDLLDTPIPAVYTRTITSPAWGARATGKRGGTAYALLGAEDRGGGSVILPGPTGSEQAPQDYRSLVGIARLRQDLGSSFLGLLYTGRNIEVDGHNQVLGPDFQWRPGPADKLTGQALWSDSETPRRPELAREWDGRRLRGHGFVASWDHTKERYLWSLGYRDFSDGFRADEGFLPQVGYRKGHGDASLTLFPKRGLLNSLRPFVSFDYAVDRASRLIDRELQPGLTFQGRLGLVGSLSLHHDQLLTGEKLLERNQAEFLIELAPSGRLTRLGLSGAVGEDIDLVNLRVGSGAKLTLTATLRPTSHLNVDLVSAWSWLDVGGPGGVSARLFTAQVERVRLVYNFTRRLYLRLIAEYVEERRDVTLYAAAVEGRSGFLSGSALLGYRMSWQTALFVGYGDDRTLAGRNALRPASRQLYLKVSYAYQR